MTTTPQAPISGFTTASVNALLEATPARSRRRAWMPVPWWFVLPAGLIYAFALVVPNFQAMVYSFTDWDGLSEGFAFVGFDNYLRAFGHPQFVPAIIRTLTLTAAVVVLQLTGGLVLAVALNARLRSRNLLRAVFFAPVVLTAVAVGYIWRYIYAPTGVLNQILGDLGLSSLQRDWLGDPQVNLAAIAVIVVWQGVGITMVIFLAGLQGIPDDIVEASHIDGANAWQRFWYITRPLLAPAMVVNAVLAVMGGLKIFDQIFVTTQGGPAYTTSTLTILTYTDGFVNGNYSFGVTLSIVLALLIAVVTIIQFRLMRGADR